MDQDLRSVMAIFEASGDLVHVSEALDPADEIAAALTLNHRGPALRFDNVKGHHMPVIGNVLNTRRKYALSLGIHEKETFLRTVHGLTHPLKPVIEAEGPCQEKVFIGEIDLLAALPLPHLCEKDRNPYVSAGVLVAKDPDTGKRNVSMNRLQVTGPDEAIVGMAPSHHLFRLLKKAEARGKSCLSQSLSEVTRRCMSPPTCTWTWASMSSRSPAVSSVSLSASCGQRPWISRYPRGVRS